jgi:hypothetical protein
MEPYRDFDLLSSGELTVTRKGLFTPVFEITDGAFTYGKVTTTTNRGLNDHPFLETSAEKWELKRKAVFDRTLLIYNSRGENIGAVTSGDHLLKLNYGFSAELLAAAGIWLNGKGEKIIKVKQSWYSYKKPYTISFDAGLIKTLPELPLMILLGTYMKFLRQTRSFR